MQTPASGALNRRDLLAGSVAALAALMLEGAAQAAHLRHATDPRRAFADRLADLVIPSTDTPGATRANVADFMLMAIDHRMAGSEPAQLAQLRAALDGAAEAGGHFMALPRARQHELLAALDARSYAGEHAPGTAEAAWPRFKSVILAGYYTSEIGASRELVFDPVPGTRENIRLTPAFRMFSNQGFGGIT
ncbi:MAG: hypothetical protein RL684_1700 [Pseudomonadota bacterium]|jgi:hypothetical protein